MTSTRYRKHLHEFRQHPGPVVQPATENGIPVALLYTSLLPFLLIEFGSEFYAEKLPAGLFFPTGFFLFWAFYYTYQRPGALETRLGANATWKPHEFPALLLALVIWGAKTLLSLVSKSLIHVLYLPPKPTPQPKTAPPRAEPAYAHSEPAVPADARDALRILGLPATTDWLTIHKRYRDLAKRYHPDLNPQDTLAGRRFMKYDAAYRSLARYRGSYFKVRR